MRQELLHRTGKESVYHGGMKIAEWIRAARAHKGLTQQQLADLLHMTKGNVSGWENGRHEPSFNQMVDVSSLTGYPMLAYGSGVPEENLTIREQSPPEYGSTPGSTWHTTHVNPNIKSGDEVQIWHLPLVPLERIELAGEPNVSPAVQALPTHPVTFGGAPYDQALDKVIILDMDVEGTIARKGHIAVFRLALGKRARQTNRPLLVRNDRGEHVMVSFSAYAGMPGVELVAVCVHSYQPMDANPFV